VRPAETSSEKFVNVGDPWRPEDARRENVLGSTAASGGGFSALGQWLLVALVQLYRIFLSPFLGGACKFYPSCSQYAQEAVALHGAKRGSLLALKRLGRCRPFTRGGFDPVPDSRLGYQSGVASRAEVPAAPKPRPGGSVADQTQAGGAPKRRETGLVAAYRGRHDYSDAEWLRTANKELAQ
jgi:uncharacterized protein